MKERVIDPLPEQPGSELSANPDSEAVIDEELARLPERYRGAIILCGIRGLTAEEAAKELACPIGTVHSRLSRGRKLLARRLAGRGVGVSAAATGVTAMAPSVSAAYVALALRGMTGAATGRAVQIADMVLRSMTVGKWGALLGAIVCAGAALVGGLALGRPRPMAAEPAQQLASAASALGDATQEFAESDFVLKGAELLDKGILSDIKSRANALALRLTNDGQVEGRIVSFRDEIARDKAALPPMQTTDPKDPSTDHSL
jgi:hypothetical protein